MNNDLISRSALKEKAETITLWNGDVRRFVSYETIDNAPTVEERTQGECKKCDYYRFSQAFINGIVEVISKYGITTVDELLETLKGGDGHE